MLPTGGLSIFWGVFIENLVDHLGGEIECRQSSKKKSQAGNRVQFFFGRARANRSAGVVFGCRGDVRDEYREQDQLGRLGVESVRIHRFLSHVLDDLEEFRVRLQPEANTVLYAGRNEPDEFFVNCGIGILGVQTRVSVAGGG